MARRTTREDRVRSPTASQTQSSALRNNDKTTLTESSLAGVLIAELEQAHPGISFSPCQGSR
jgi:hypothetical protein